MIRLFALTALAVALAACHPETQIGPNNWCSIGDRGVLVLVDRTTPFTEREQSQIRESLTAISGSLEPGDMIQLRTIEDLFANSVTRDLGCRPGCPESTGITSAGANCSQGIALHADRRFQTNMENAIEEVMRVDVEQSRSDVSATVAGSIRGFSSERPITDLYIFSDMIENSQHMPGDRFFQMDTAELVQSMRENEALPELSGANVHIIGLGRDHAASRGAISAQQTAHLRAFWNAYFTAANGRAPTYESSVTR